MTTEKGKDAGKLQYELSVAENKLKQLDVLGDVFMNYVCQLGTEIIFKEDQLNTIHEAYFRAKLGIQEFTE